jgi:predicted nucleotidyltransferase
MTERVAANLSIPYDAIAEFCERHHIRKLALFGSVLRDDFRPDSDVDVLVEFEPGRKITFLDLAASERALTTLLGRKVDLREPEELSRYFRDRVLASAQTIYERA